jgi:hypothetical protein
LWEFIRRYGKICNSSPTCKGDEKALAPAQDISIFMLLNKAAIQRGSVGWLSDFV